MTSSGAKGVCQGVMVHPIEKLLESEKYHRFSSRDTSLKVRLANHSNQGQDA
jgi:hypothetical protein